MIKENADFYEGVIGEQLTRIGVDYEALGPVDSICVSVDSIGNGVRLFDDHGSAYVSSASDAWNILKTLPDNAGWEAFWEAFTNFPDEKPND